MEQASQREVKQALGAAEEYLLRVKGWKPKEFRIDSQGLSSDGGELVVWGVFLEDETNPQPGKGRSVELHINLKTLEVSKELAFQ